MKLYLIPVGEVEERILEILKSPLKEKFGFEVELEKSIPIPQNSYDPLRKQFNSVPILKKLEEIAPKDAFRVLGILDVDLYTEGLNFIFGQANLSGRLALISIIRLRQEFYGLKPDAKIFRKRVLKEAVHELGHTLGLGHCQNSYCVMHFSNSLRDTDIKGEDFCKTHWEETRRLLRNLR